MTTTETLRGAIAFAARGHAVLPLHGITERGGKRCCTCGDGACSSPGKHPHARLAPHGKDSATTDTDTIKTWFAEHDWLNYGVTTDTLPTIDIDPRNGGDKAWLKLVREHYDVHTWRVKTGGGGEHIIFGSTPKPVPCGKLTRGVDVKGAGGYIVGAGSLHASGSRYHWFKDCHPSNTTLVAPPRWVLDKLDKPKWNGKPRTAEYYCALVADAFEGERNEKTAALFGHLYGTAFPDRAVLYTLMRAWNLAYCHPPLERDEFDRIAVSIATRENKKRGRA